MSAKRKSKSLPLKQKIEPATIDTMDEAIALLRTAAAALADSENLEVESINAIGITVTLAMGRFADIRKVINDAR